MPSADPMTCHSPYRWWRPATWAALLTGVTWLVVVAGAPALLRVPIVLAFCVAAPGLAVVAPIRLENPLLEAMLALATSIAIVILVSFGMVKWVSWSTTPLLASLTIPVLGGLAIERCRRSGRRAQEGRGSC